MKVVISKSICNGDIAIHNRMFPNKHCQWEFLSKGDSILLSSKFNQ